MELEEELKEANEALEKYTELTRLEKTRDEANQNAAVATEITDLKPTPEGVNEDLARELENTDNRREETAGLEAPTASSNAERTSPQDQQADSQHLLQGKDAEIEPIHARRLPECDAQRYWRLFGGWFSGANQTT